MPVVPTLMVATDVNATLASPGMALIAQVGLNLHCELSVITFFLADIDECKDSTQNNCSSNANCTDRIGSYDCICSVGYTGDGYSCDGRPLPEIKLCPFIILPALLRY